MIAAEDESPSEPNPNGDAVASAPATTVALPGDAAAGPVELDLGYRVDLEAFSGPLDLLLFLVRRAEVDLVDIPVATIADQFIAAVSSWQEMDLEVAGDFILMAASLLELKSRLVAPPVEGEATGEEADEEILDPRAELSRRRCACSPSWRRNTARPARASSANSCPRIPTRSTATTSPTAIPACCS
jgi:hypothetical protein